MNIYFALTKSFVSGASIYFELKDIDKRNIDYWKEED
jgi:hypothetical protein